MQTIEGEEVIMQTNEAIIMDTTEGNNVDY